MTYRGHSILRTLIRCHFSPMETTGAQYLYSGSADGKIHVITCTRASEVRYGSCHHPRFGRLTVEWFRYWTGQRHCLCLSVPQDLNQNRQAVYVRRYVYVMSVGIHR